MSSVTGTLVEWRKPAEARRDLPRDACHGPLQLPGPVRSRVRERPGARTAAGPGPARLPLPGSPSPWPLHRGPAPAGLAGGFKETRPGQPVVQPRPPAVPRLRGAARLPAPRRLCARTIDVARTARPGPCSQDPSRSMFPKAGVTLNCRWPLPWPKGPPRGQGTLRGGALARGPGDRVLFGGPPATKVTCGYARHHPRAEGLGTGLLCAGVSCPSSPPPAPR